MGQGDVFSQFAPGGGGGGTPFPVPLPDSGSRSFLGGTPVSVPCPLPGGTPVTGPMVLPGWDWDTHPAKTEVSTSQCEVLAVSNGCSAWHALGMAKTATRVP